MRKKITALKNATKQLANLLLAGLLISTVNVFAQSNSLKQVIVLNEGRYGAGPVTMGSYQPDVQTYTTRATIKGARFASDVLIDDNFIYVAADRYLNKYDLNTYELLGSRMVRGIRKLAVWNNQLLVTKGEMETSLLTHFAVYDKNSLALLYEKKLKGNAEGIIVNDDKAYIAVNCWGDCGELSIVDLKNQSILESIDLGAGGLNPENVMEREGKVFTLNNLDWTTSSITIFEPGARTLTSFMLNTPSSCSASMISLQNIYFQAHATTELGRFDVVEENLKSPLVINKTIYGMDADVTNNLIYVSETDFQTYGKVHIYTTDGVLQNSFDAGISPGNFAFDVRPSASAKKANLLEGNDNSSYGKLPVYPNPVSDVLHIGFIDGEDKTATLILTDVLGREIYQQQINTHIPQTLFLSTLPQGIYFLKVETTTRKTIQKVVKQ